MDMEDLRLFLDIRQTGTITKAAGCNFMTQSALSKRLDQLEKELGVALFERHKGKNNVLPTPAGIELTDIAQRMLNLYAQAMELREHSGRQSMTAACINSAQCYLLPSFVGMLQQKAPDLNITLEDHHTAEIIELVRARRVDIGITHSVAPYPELHSELLYDEAYRVIMLRENAPYPQGAVLSPEQLEPGHEIYEYFDGHFQTWHDQWWNRCAAKVRVNVTSTAEHYFSDCADWSIVPSSVALSLENRGFISYVIAPAPPRHEVYMIYQVRDTPRSAQIFADHAREYFCNKV